MRAILLASATVAIFAGLRDLLAVAARELLAHRLDHLSGARDDLERLGDVLAELREPIPTAGRAGTGQRLERFNVVWKG